MSQITYPFNIAAGDPESAGPMMANFQAVSAVVNGGLELGTNVSAAAPVAQTSAALLAGSSLSAARADHQHVIRGLEQLTADPTSNNFLTRVYANTSTGKLRVCINPAGAGTWATFGNMAATELPVHAGNHIAGGSDQLNPPTCLLTKTGTVGITVATLTALTFGASTEVFDNDTMHDTSVNPTRITFTHAGLYSLEANVTWAATSATGNRWSFIQLNGAGTVLAGNIAPGAVDENSVNAPHCKYIATAGDYVELYVYQESGGTLNVLGTGSSLVLGTRTAAMQFSAVWLGQG